MTAPVCMAAQHLRTLRIRLPAHPASAAAARRVVKEVIRLRDLDIDSYVAALLVSELITNALRHGLREEETLQLVITSADNWLRVAVHDSSPCEPVLVNTPPDAEEGRGLALLASLSASWGFQQTSTGKAVYFTLEAEPGDLASDAEAGGFTSGAQPGDEVLNGEARFDHWRPPRL